MNDTDRRRTKVFVDLDGTLAEFRHVDTMETLYEKGYFLNLKPMKGVIDAAAKLAKSDKYDVYILSSVLSDSKYALAEKKEWRDRHLPQIPVENRLFPPCGTPKHEWLAAFHFKADKSCILIDDYSRNLLEWEQRGKGIKLMNGINGTGGTWKGARINHDDPQLYESMTEAIREIERENLLPEFEQTPLVEQELESGIIYNDTVEVERGVINESEYIHNNLMLIEERMLTSEEEITKEKAVELLAEDLMYRDREAVCVLSLDEEGMPINGSVVSVGTISESPLSSKDVFKTPILSGADSIILMHNHPSGTPGPSNQDLDATRLLIDAANAVGLKVEDHIIVEGLSGQIHRMRDDGILNDMENGQWGQMLVKPVKKAAEHEKGDKKIMKELNEQNFTQTLLKHTENSGYTLEVHDDKLLIVDIEGPEPFWEEITLEYARENACSRLEEDIRKNGEYYRKNGELDTLKDDLEFLRGYDIDAAEDTVFKELRQKTEFHMQKLPAFKQEQLPEQTAMNSFTGKDLQEEMTMEI